MSDRTGLSRRGFLAANAAVAAAATVPVAASAGTAPAKSHKALGWHNVTAEGMAQLIGDRFRVTAAGTGDLVLELVAVEPVQSGPARPGHLPRAEGLVAVFDSPDKGPVVDCGCGIYRVSHARLGAADLYLGPSPLRRGGHVVEMVLN